MPENPFCIEFFMVILEKIYYLLDLSLWLGRMIEYHIEVDCIHLAYFLH